MTLFIAVQPDGVMEVDAADYEAMLRGLGSAWDVGSREGPEIWDAAPGAGWRIFGDWMANIWFGMENVQ